MSPAPKQRKHLMDPSNPRPVRQEPMSLGSVQRWILSFLGVFLIMQLAIGPVLAVAYADQARPSSTAGLLVMSGIFGIGAMSVGRLIHAKRIVSLWLALGLIPSLVGVYIAYLAG
jgi:hypothetical protein